MSYKQLTHEQRYQIYALLKMEHNQTEIAKCLDVHKATISREIQRNKGRRGYRPRQAHFKALSRRDHSQTRIMPQTWQLIKNKICEEWSPEQISGWVKKHEAIQISHEWIYQYILANKRTGGTLYKHLRCQKERRKRYGSYDHRGKLPNRVSIEQRPAIVDRRQRVGDWEVDTMIGKGHQQAIVTLIERKSRFALLQKVEYRTADLVGNAVIALLQPFSTCLHTITGDNGKEFAEHEYIAEQLQIDFFFAHPFSAWERGANENLNGLVRQYIPKKRALHSVSHAELQQINNRLNHRPRKCLDYLTPFEVFFEQYCCT